MGRDKPNKPRGGRPAPWRRPTILAAMKPPGELYDPSKWVSLLPGSGEHWLTVAPRMSQRAVLKRLAPLYGGVIPPAAVLLEGFIQAGAVPFYAGPGETRPMPVELIVQNAATMFPGATAAGVAPRDVLHALHADGVFVLAEDVPPGLRMVVAWPGDERGSTEWRFLDQMSRADQVGQMAVNAAAVAAEGDDDPTVIRQRALDVADEALRRSGMVPG